MVVAVAMIVIAAMLIVRYTRKANELENKESELDAAELKLRRRTMEIENWSAKVDQNAKRQATMKHVYANVEVYDNSENKPAKKDIRKSLSSKIGYAIRREFPAIKERHDLKNGGRTVYSVDFYVKPFED